MTNKYKGKCHKCNATVDKHAGIVEKEFGKWLVSCLDCTANNIVEIESSSEDYPCSDMGYEDQCRIACGL